MIDMVMQSILPQSIVLKKEGILEKAVVDSCKAVADKLAEVHKQSDDCKKAEICRELRLTTMVTCREACDEAEALYPAASWPFATYRELLFFDQNQDHQGRTPAPHPRKQGQGSLVVFSQQRRKNQARDSAGFVDFFSCVCSQNVSALRFVIPSLLCSSLIKISCGPPLGQGIILELGLATLL